MRPTRVNNCINSDQLSALQSGGDSSDVRRAFIGESRALPCPRWRLLHPASILDIPPPLPLLLFNFCQSGQFVRNPWRGKCCIDILSLRDDSPLPSQPSRTDATPPPPPRLLMRARPFFFFFLVDSPWLLSSPEFIMHTICDRVH